MSYPFLQNIHTFWANNTALNTALPATSVYTGIAPAGLGFPYAVVTIIASVPQQTTGTDYVESCTFQVSVFHTDPDSCLSISESVCKAFDLGPLSSTVAGCIRTNQIFTVTPDCPMLVYMSMVEYRYIENRTLGI